MNVELMLEVKRRVLEQPKSVNMDTFCDYVKGPRAVKEGFCGAVGCISGHAIFASGISLKAMRDFSLSAHALGRALLGLSNKEAHELFYFHNDVDCVKARECLEEDCPYYQFSKRLKKQRAGSVRYAKIVAGAIDHAIKRAEEGVMLCD